MGFIYSQLFKSLPEPTTSFAGKTVVITGSNTGLGKEAARHFVRLGATKLILAVRSLAKGNEAKADIQAGFTEVEHEDTDIQVWHLDMGIFSSVKAFASRVNTELDRVDAFLANAGVARTEYAVKEGHEETITVNVISTFLLAALVMPKLKQTAVKYKTRPTLTITTSEVHGWTKFPQKDAPEGKLLETISDREQSKKYFGEQYPVSKLLEVLAVRALAERHPSSLYPVTLNCVNPGLCSSEFGRDISSWGFWLLKLALARTTEQGSRTLVNAASLGAESHGKYLSDCAVDKPSAWVRRAEGHAAGERLWLELSQTLDKIAPGVTNNF